MDNDQPIRDAATLVILDRSGHEPRVLLGRRRPDQVFLPNVFVFPGGRVDDEDALAPSIDELSTDEAALLSLPRDGHAPYSGAFVRSLALAAVRETFEETGLAAGVRVTQAIKDGAPQSWCGFMATGVVPRLEPLNFFLRAITPPRRPRRYDTRFFLVDASEIAFRGQATDDELSEVDWFVFPALQALDVPRMTRIVIKELERLVVDGLKPAAERRVPLYSEQNGVMNRAELSLAAARS